MNKEMREIKFRAWSKKGKNWVSDKVYIDDEGCVIAFGFSPMIDVSDDVEVSLFTGLHDHNGKEIYEGDIVEMVPDDLSSEYLDGMISHTGKVKWISDGCEYWVSLFPPKNKVQYSGNEFLVLRGIDWNSDDNEVESSMMKVIGNVYENDNLNDN